MDVRVRRIYDPVDPAEGKRVLVDRLWPRGVSKERADLFEWLKAVAPSTELREWYAHDPAKFADFTARYTEELADADHADAWHALQQLAAAGTVTLLTASKAVDISEAAVLRDLLVQDAG